MSGQENKLNDLEIDLLYHTKLNFGRLNSFGVHSIVIDRLVSKKYIAQCSDVTMFFITERGMDFLNELDILREL